MPAAYQLPAVCRAFDLPAAAATLAHSLGPVLVWGDRSVYGSHGYEGVKITDVAVRPGASRDDLAVYLQHIEALCVPSDSMLAAKKLAELRALTAHRARDDVDIEVMADAYTHRLAQYPPDVVVAACDGWADGDNFWPTWAELKGACERRMRGRVQIRDALRRALQ
jgi:hypothetical protein